MSAMPNHYKGKLVLIPRIENETLEEQCKRILTDELVCSYYDIKELESDYENYYNRSYTEMFHKTCSAEAIGKLIGSFVIIDDSIYQILSALEVNDFLEDIYNVYNNEDGMYNYEIRYNDNFRNAHYIWNKEKDFENAIIRAIKNKEN